MPAQGSAQRLLRVALLDAMAFGCSSEDPKEGKDGPPDTSADTGAVDAGCNCPADTVCATQRCLPSGKCEAVARPDGTPCSDGDVCSVGDVCSEGKCAAGPHSQCECKESKECSDDGDKCNGVQFCDKKTLPWRCRTKPGTVVVCQPVGGSVSAIACAASTCDPKTGKCATTSKNEGLSCDDGDKCTVDDTCAKGACAGVNVCSCKTTKDCAAQEDGNPCNGELYCDVAAGKCAVNPTTVVKCDPKDDTDCTAATCSKTTGLCQLTARPTSTKCNDGDKCTTGDHCSGGSCVAGNVTCACKTNKDCLAFDDGDKCNGIPVCDKTSGTCKPNPASVISCASVNDTACLHNVCLPKEGTCTMTARADVKLSCETKKDAGGKPYQACKWRYKQPGDAADKGPFACSDGDVCTTGETCDGGKCKPSATVCKCKTNADCVDKDDGDLCNGTYYCDKSLKIADCVFNPASKVLCSKKDDTTCAQAKCDKKTGNCGLQAVNLGKPCDDGKLCTIASVCQGDGGCAGGKPNPCDDKDPCTVDSCGTKAGCSHKARNCDDGNACTSNACDKKTGQCVKKLKADNTVCNADGNGCTVGDGCQKGVCKAGSKVNCVDKTGPCQATICQSIGATSHKCVVANVKDGSACPDGKDSCYLGAKCAAGKCVKGKVARLRYYLADSVKGYSVLYDVVPLPGGGAVAVGAMNVKAVAPPGDTRMWYMRFNKLMTRDKTQHGPTGEASTDTAARRVFADDGVIWVAGTSKVGKGRVLTLRRLDAELKTTKTWHVKPTPDDNILTAVTRGLSGFFFAAKRRAAGAIKGYTLVRIGEDGKVVWHKAFGAANTVQHAITMTAKGKLFTAGAEYIKGQPTHELWRLWSPVDGSLIDDILDSNDDARAPVVAIPAAGDAVEVLQWVREAGKTHTLFTWVEGKLAYARRIPGTTTGAVPRAMIRTKSGDTVAVGSTSTADAKASDQSDAWIRIGDRFTNTIREHVFGGGGDDDLNAVAETDDGLLLVAGGRAIGGAYRGWLMQTGPWGYRSCTNSGVCWKTKRGACDDGKPCTRDGCDPAKGCKPLTQNDGSYCPPPYKCGLESECISGKCQPGANGKLHVGTLDHGKNATLAVEPSNDGGTGIAWRYHNGRLEHWDVSFLGQVTSPYEHKVCGGIHSVASGSLLLNGDMVVTGTNSVSGAPQGVFCLADLADDTDDSKTAWKQNVAAPKACPKCAVRGVQAVGTVDNSVYTLASFKGAVHGAIVSRVLKTGTVKWGYVATRKGQQLDPRAIIANQDAAPVVAGGVAIPGQPSAEIKAWLMRLNVHGSKVFDRTYDNTSPMRISRFVAVAESPYRGYVAAGMVSPNNLVRKMRVMGVDGNGKHLWTWSPQKVDMSAAKVVLPGPGSAFTVVGDVEIGGKSRLQVRIVAGSKLLVERTNPHAVAVLSPGVGVRLKNGGVMVGGRMTDDDGIWMAGFARSGPFGFSDCDSAKDCSLKQAAHCNDQNNCTVDYCQPGVGCKHAPISMMACGANRNCTNGKCVATP